MRFDVIDNQKMSLVKYLTHDADDTIDWTETETCYYSTAPQCTKLWDRLHIGAVSASKLSIWLGLSKFSEGPEESARQCVGLSVKTFNSTELDRTQAGIKGEPVLRSWYSGVIGEDIREVGVAVWKADPRFRASLDGIYGTGDSLYGVELKITDRVYWPLVQYYQARSRGLRNLPDSPHVHIWDAHYNQMIQCMAIAGLKSIDYIVAGYGNNKVYIEKIFPDPDHWNDVLLPKGRQFIETYVTPLMTTHGIQRIDPWMMAPKEVEVDV